MSTINTVGLAIADLLESRYGILFADDSEDLVENEILSAVIPLAYEPVTGNSRCSRKQIQYAFKVVSRRDSELEHFEFVEMCIDVLNEQKTVVVDNTTWLIKDIQMAGLVDWPTLKSGFIKTDILFTAELKN